jgi:hypothetical protein
MIKEGRVFRAEVRPVVSTNYGREYKGEELMYERAAKTVISLYIGITLLWCSVVGIVIYAIVHFARKYW